MIHSIRIIRIFLILTYLTLPSLAEQSFRNKIGEMFIIGFHGEEVTLNSSIAEKIQNHHVGGVILFGRNIKDPGQLGGLTGALQALAKENRLEDEGPLLIGIDQEGGQVSRLTGEKGFGHVQWSPRELGEMDDVEFTYFYADSLGRYMRELGINLNFAPVVDLAVNPDNFIVKKGRIFSKNATVVYQQGEAFVRGMQQNGIITSLKHFPGHGSSFNDTHVGFADVTSTWILEELLPYREFINCLYSDMVMIGHVVLSQFSSSSESRFLPATFSYDIVTKILREDMQFQGVIISDDMTMGAISRGYDLEEALKYGINAGINMFILANHWEDQTVEAIEIIMRLVSSGEITVEKIEESYNRIIRLKKILNVSSE